MTKKVFISYSRKDTVVMKQVKNTLLNAGIPVWTDEAIQPGTESWKREIESAIGSAEAFVLIMSPDAKKSRWVHEEINYAEIINVKIIPLLANGDASTSIPFGLTSFQWIDIRGTNFDMGLQRLAKLLKSTLNNVHITKSNSALYKSSQRTDVDAPIAFSLSNRLYIILEDSKAQKVISPQGYTSNWFSWSPDGSKISFLSYGTNGNRIYVCDQNGDNLDLVASGDHVTSYPAWSADSRSVFFYSRDTLYNVDCSGKMLDRFSFEKLPNNVISSPFGAPLLTVDGFLFIPYPYFVDETFYLRKQKFQFIDTIKQRVGFFNLPEYHSPSGGMMYAPPIQPLSSRILACLVNYTLKPGNPTAVAQIYDFSPGDSNHNLRRITNNERISYYLAARSSDHKRIIYTCYYTYDATSSPHIGIMSSNGMDEKILRGGYSCCLSKDGTKIYFGDIDKENHNLSTMFTMDINGGNVKKIALGTNPIVCPQY